MLRLIHAQTVVGALLVDDIDDGLPNKTVHRMGSNANPKAYARDGYANKAKQPCYIPLKKPTDATLAGYIDLNQSERVVLSAGKGKIKKLQTAGLITVVSFVASDLAAPTVATAVLSTNLTITCTKALSVAPNISKVVITGTGAVTLTQAQITGGGGTFSDTSIFIPAALIPSVVTTASSVKLQADDQLSNTVVVT